VGDGAAVHGTRRSTRAPGRGSGEHADLGAVRVGLGVLGGNLLAGRLSEHYPAERLLTSSAAASVGKSPPGRICNVCELPVTW
jgi:hypothetical protein